MKRVLYLLFICVLHTNLSAQSVNFENVYKACMLAQSSMSYGIGSQVEIREAANLLTKTSWSPLILQNVDIKHEASIKNHLVFSPEFYCFMIKHRRMLRNRHRQEQRFH